MRREIIPLCTIIPGKRLSYRCHQPFVRIIHHADYGKLLWVLLHFMSYDGHIMPQIGTFFCLWYLESLVWLSCTFFSIYTHTLPYTIIYYITHFFSHSSYQSVCLSIVRHLVPYGMATSIPPITLSLLMLNHFQSYSYTSSPHSFISFFFFFNSPTPSLHLTLLISFDQFLPLRSFHMVQVSLFQAHPFVQLTSTDLVHLPTRKNMNIP